MSEWKTCPKCKCMNKNRTACVDCGRDLKDVAPEQPKASAIAEAKGGSLERAGWAAEDSARMQKALGRLNAWRTKWATTSQDLTDIQDEFFILAGKLTNDLSNNQTQARPD